MKTESRSALPWLWLSVVIIVIDQVSKYFVQKHLVYNQPYKVLPFFNLNLSYNTGAAFSFMHSAGGWQVMVFAIFSFVVALAFCIWLARTNRSDWLMGLALSLIIGGAIGNLIDRVRLQYVIDFLDFHIQNWHYAIFNFADSAVVVGAICLIVRIVLVKKN